MGKSSPGRPRGLLGRARRICRHVLSGPRGLHRWLALRGASLEGVVLRRSSIIGAGFGVFAAKNLPAGSVAGYLPRILLPTASTAIRMEQAKALAKSGLSKEIRYWLELALARRCPSHIWHRYAAALPCCAPDPLNWSEASRAQLQGTHVAKVVVDAEETLRSEWTLAREILKELGGRSTRISWNDLLWARGMHLSRCFPADLAESESPVKYVDGQRVPGEHSDSLGLLWPFFDMTNHNPEAAVAWETPGTQGESTGDAEVPADSIAFRTLVDVKEGDELLNNYGSRRPNDELLFFHGFALEANPSDTVPVFVGGPLGRPKLAAMKRSLLQEFGVAFRVADGDIIIAGPMQLGPRDDKTRQLIPEALWHALAVLTLGSFKDPVEVTTHECDILKQQLQLQLSRIDEFTAETSRDVTFYRVAQARILREALSEIGTKYLEFEREAQKHGTAGAQQGFSVR